MTATANKRKAHDNFLVFVSDSVHYAVPLLSASEVIPLCPCTRVPHAQEWIRGVANIRGRVVPIVDLHSRLHPGSHNGSPATSLVLMELPTGEQRNLVAFSCDRVVEATTIPQEDLTPLARNSAPSALIWAIAPRDPPVFLLDTDKLALDEQDS